MPSSVVHTGVKSAGCEYSTPQLSPSHWWKWMGPSLDCCSKSGAMSPRRKVMTVLRGMDLVSSRPQVRSGAAAKLESLASAHHPFQRRDAHEQPRKAMCGVRAAGCRVRAAGGRLK